jgi:hypothetical protein
VRKFVHVSLASISSFIAGRSIDREKTDVNSTLLRKYGVRVDAASRRVECIARIDELHAARRRVYLYASLGAP